jgi:hypothetical protein
MSSMPPQRTRALAEGGWLIGPCGTNNGGVGVAEAERNVQACSSQRLFGVCCKAQGAGHPTPHIMISRSAVRCTGGWTVCGGM